MAKTIKRRAKRKALDETMGDISRSSDIDQEFAAFLQERGAKVPPIFTRELTHSAGKLETAGLSEDEFNPEILKIEVFEKMKLDPQVAIGLGIIKLPIMSLGFNIICNDPIVKAVIKSLVQPHWRGLLKTALTSVDYGYCVAEEVYERRNLKITDAVSKKPKVIFDKEAIGIRKIKGLYPNDDIILKFDKKNNLEGFTQQAMIGDRVFVPKEKMFHFAINDEFGQSYGKSRLRSSYNPWYLKILTMQFLMRHLERKGSAAMIATAPPGSSKTADGTSVDNVTEATKAARQLLSHAVVGLPYTESKNGNKQWNIELLEQKARSHESFLEVLQYLDTQILRGILVPERTITQDSGTGSFSMSQTHADFFLLSEEGIIKDMEDSINEHVIHDLLRFNFPQMSLEECKLQVDTLQFGKKQMMLNLMTKIIDNSGNFLKNAGGVPYDALPDFAKMAEILEVPLKPLEINRDFGINLPEEEAKKRIDPKKSSVTDEELQAAVKGIILGVHSDKKKKKFGGGDKKKKKKLIRKKKKKMDPKDKFPEAPGTFPIEISGLSSDGKKRKKKKKRIK